MSWKDYFYFTRSERNGLIIFNAILIVIIIFPYLYSYFTPPEVYDNSQALKSIEKYEIMLREAQMVKEQSGLLKEVEKPLTPVSFDPNSISREECLEMGLSERLINNLFNYRSAGGKFRFREDFRKLYSMNDTLYNQLKDYIKLPHKTAPQYSRDTILQALQTERKEVPEVIIIKINSADTTEWQKIRGIGPVFSKRIVSYRELLGGFFHISQLMEVYGMDSTRYNQILPQLIVDSVPLRKININKADFATLLRHPYLNRNQVNSIIRMREIHGFYNSVEEIKKSEIISDEDYVRLAPYLSVEDTIEILP